METISVILWISSAIVALVGEQMLFFARKKSADKKSDRIGYLMLGIAAVLIVIGTILLFV